MGFVIRSNFPMGSDWLSDTAFTQIYNNRSEAIAVAIEGVTEPDKQEVRVVDTETGEVVWRSTKDELLN